MYLIDTDICIQYMRKDKKVVDRISQLNDLNISIITLCELFYGIFNSKNTPKHKKTLANFLSNVFILNTDFSTAYSFGRIKSTLKNKGRFSGDFDMINAAFAQVYDLTIITRNIKHYDKIKGVKIITF